MSLANLKNRLGNTDTLKKALEETSGKKDFTDPRIWTYKKDKNTGSATATFRFLPDTAGGRDYIKTHVHSGKNKANDKGFYVPCRTDLGEECPICKINDGLWNDASVGPEKQKANQNFVSNNTKRRMSYYSNILMIDDPANPENNGKVFIFKYGLKIMEKIEKAMNPASNRKQPVYAFDPWTGANFILEVNTSNDQTNYDQSSFELPEAIFPDDDEDMTQLSALLEKCHDIYDSYGDPKNYKDNDEVMKNFTRAYPQFKEAGQDGSADSMVNELNQMKAESGMGAGSQSADDLIGDMLESANTPAAQAESKPEPTPTPEPTLTVDDVPFETGTPPAKQESTPSSDADDLAAELEAMLD